MSQVTLAVFSLISENDTFLIKGAVVYLVRVKMIPPIRHRHKMMTPIDIFCHRLLCVRSGFVLDGLAVPFLILVAAGLDSMARGRAESADLRTADRRAGFVFSG